MPHGQAINCHGSSIAAGSGKGASLELHASPTLHPPPWSISTTPSRRTTRDNPGLPLPALRSITGLGNDGFFEVDRWTLNLKTGASHKDAMLNLELGRIGIACIGHQSGLAVSIIVMITLQLPMRSVGELPILLAFLLGHIA